MSARMAPSPPADCTSGSGRFRMLVHDWADADGDGDAIGLLVPIMTSGTGVMTKHAWVDSIAVVTEDVDSLRVVDVDEGVRFVDDALVDASSISTVLSGTTTFSSGEITGRPAIVAEGWSASGAPDVELDIAWTCSTDPFHYQPQPPGYVFSLDDIGCSWNQDVVVRNGPGRFLWQARGDATAELESPTTEDMYGNLEFTLTFGSFEMVGEATSVGPQSATFDLSSITYAGVPVCTTGTYTFPAEG